MQAVTWQTSTQSILEVACLIDYVGDNLVHDLLIEAGFSCLKTPQVISRLAHLLVACTSKLCLFSSVLLLLPVPGVSTDLGKC